MFCQNCGMEVASSYKFCPKCGGKSFGSGVAQPISQVTPASGGQGKIYSHQCWRAPKTDHLEGVVRVEF